MRKKLPKRTAKLSDRKTVRGKEWKKSITIASNKYDIISKAVLKTLTTKPVRFYELAAKVKKAAPKFPGSVSWYTVSALRALENEGKVVRTKGKTITYHKRGNGADPL